MFKANTFFKQPTHTLFPKQNVADDTDAVPALLSSFYGKLSVMGVLLVLATFASVSFFAHQPKAQYVLEQQTKLREQLIVLQADESTKEYPWMRTLNPKAERIEGKLVWNQTQQAGMIEVKRLPDISRQQQYHIWIFDRNKSGDQPISAGVFHNDQHTPNDLLVVLKPEDEVISPYKFFLTLEDKSGQQQPQNLLRAQP
ncbi:MAG: anti-sigma factor domain-containing protein [bacterium]